jgi:hypothetical protein
VFENIIVIVIIIIIIYYLRFTSETFTHAPDSNNRIMTSAVDLSTNDGSDYCENLMARKLGPANTTIRYMKRQRRRRKLHTDSDRVLVN